MSYLQVIGSGTAQLTSVNADRAGAAISFGSSSQYSIYSTETESPSQCSQWKYGLPSMYSLAKARNLILSKAQLKCGSILKALMVIVSDATGTIVFHPQTFHLNLSQDTVLSCWFAKTGLPLFAFARRDVGRISALQICDHSIGIVSEF